MEPFDRYPHGGLQLLGQRRGDTARRHYGLKLWRFTGVRHCAYCNLDLFSSFETWLLLCVDHVVPESVAIAAGIPKNYYNDMANCVLACNACNGFDNHYKMKIPTCFTDWSLLDFLELRDQAFIERFTRVEMLRDKERAFYASLVNSPED